MADGVIYIGQCHAGGLVVGARSPVHGPVAREGHLGSASSPEKLVLEMRGDAAPRRSTAGPRLGLSQPTATPPSPSSHILWRRGRISDGFTGVGPAGAGGGGEGGEPGGGSAGEGGRDGGRAALVNGPTRRVNGSCMSRGEILE